MLTRHKQILAFLIVAIACGILGVLLGNLSNQVAATISGSICGVLAAIPTSLLAVWWRRA